MSTPRQTLVARRKQIGLTQQALACELSVEVRTIRRWELGETTPQGSMFTKLAETLQVTRSELTALLANNLLPSRIMSNSCPDIEQWDFQREDLAQRYSTEPSTRLLASASRLFIASDLALATTHGTVDSQRWTWRAGLGAILMSKIIWDISNRTDIEGTLEYLSLAKKYCLDSQLEQVKHLYNSTILRESMVHLYSLMQPDDCLSRLYQLMGTRSYIDHDGTLRLHAAEAEAMRGDHRAALRHLEKAEALENDAARFHRMAGATLLRLHDLPNAINELTQAADVSVKTRPIILANRALAFAGLADFDSAATDLDDAITVYRLAKGGGSIAPIRAAFAALRKVDGDRVQSLRYRWMNLALEG